MDLLTEILEACKEIQESNLPVIVEGKNDVKSLKKLGFTFFFTLRKPIYKIIEELNERNITKVIILTDFDSKGIQLYKKIKSECSQRGIKINSKLRSLLRKSKIIHIEGLATYLSNLGPLISDKLQKVYKICSEND